MFYVGQLVQGKSIVVISQRVDNRKLFLNNPFILFTNLFLWVYNTRKKFRIIKIKKKEILMDPINQQASTFSDRLN